MPLSVATSAQAPALGSAIHAAVAAGRYPDVPAAAAVMGRVDRDAYLPDAKRAAAYDGLFAIYQELHDHFGRATSLMRRLKALR
jgi:L-ribulokinase